MAAAKGSQEQKMVKDMGWEKISLTQKKGFEGAAHSFDSVKGSKIALCFGLHEAFIVKDAQGIFSVNELYHGIIKETYFDVEESGEIEGAKVLAWEEDGVVSFNDILAEELGLTSDAVQEDIKSRILALASLDQLIDVKLS